MNETEAYLKKKEYFDTLSMLNDLAYTATGKTADFVLTRDNSIVCYIHSVEYINASAMEFLKSRSCVRCVELVSDVGYRIEMGELK